MYLERKNFINKIPQQLHFALMYYVQFIPNVWLLLYKGYTTIPCLDIVLDDLFYSAYTVQL